MEMLGNRQGKKRKRWLALLMAGAMVLSGMGTPSVVVQAEETDKVVVEAEAATVSGNENVEATKMQSADTQDDTQSAPEEAQIAVLSEEVAVSAQDAAGDAEQYVLDVTDLAQFTNGAKKDGEEQSAGTDDYFTILWSSKSKVDGSKKSFEDGTAFTQRINLGGKLDVTNNKNGVSFKTTGAAEVKVYWVEGGDDNRQMALLTGSGTVVAKTEETLAKNAACISVLKVTEAGTYYLGGLENNNYIFKVVVTPEKEAEPVSVTHTLDAADLEVFGAGAKKDGEEQSAGTDDYFTILWSSKSKVDGSNKSFDDGTTLTRRINMGGKLDVTNNKNGVSFKTTGAAEVKVYWVEGGDDNRQMALLTGSGTVVAKTEETLAKNAACISVLKVTEAGTYYLGGLENNNYIFKVIVTETTGGTEKPARADWSIVENPEIISAVQNAGKVDVTVKTNIGYDGADKIEVAMSDAEGSVIGTAKSSKEGNEAAVSFTPAASGTYTFTVKAIRDGEEDKAGNSMNADFVLPLTAPKISSATNVGKGAVALEWSEVKEAEKYVVTVEGTDNKTESTTTAATISGLTVGNTYTISVAAVRGEDVSGKDTTEVTVVDEAQRVWSVSSYGSSTDSKKNGVIGNINDGKVTVYSEGGKGKIVPGSTDGLTFSYTEIDPETENFTLTATVKVDNWTLSNGQEGFGLMVADTVGPNGDGTALWNNCFQNIATKMEYYWDGEDVTTDTSASKISMKLGLGTIAKTGVTAQDVADIKSGKLVGTPAGFNSVSYTLETSAAALGGGTYNVVGNYKGAEPTGCLDNLLTEFRLQIQRNNTGYILRYLDQDDNVIGEKLFYDIERTELTQIDPDSIYVGFFASRNARITVTDVDFTTIHPDLDAPAEERKFEYVYPINSIESAAFANSADYDLVYYGNANGRLVITDAAGNEIVNKDFSALSKEHIAVTLNAGRNIFDVTFVPDQTYRPGEYMEMTSYDTVNFQYVVEYKTAQNNNIYVSPDGKANAAGTKEAPVDIYTAVKTAAPGQKIILKEGTYHLSQTVKVERGINGTADAMIYMIADPDATTRPVFDFGGNCAGMILAGDYWYFQGFDVTRSADAQKGIQVSGNHNTLDRLQAYRNGNTGIQISRYLGTDRFDQWPSDNLILNCSSYLNADKGYEDADGFAAKLTVGEGNVFDGCIAAYNADDGWDLFAKVQTGSIGVVTIQNCLAFKNGYVLDAEGKEINAGNGNGFKMGGDSMPGSHVLKNSIAFANKAKGIDSNSCPDIKVYNSISYNNESYNVAFYTNTAVNTAFYAEGILSYKTSNKVAEQYKPKGTQKDSDVNNASNYYFNGTKSVNSEGKQVDDTWFVSLDMEAALHGGITRNADGTLNMNGFLELTDVVPEGIGAVVTGQSSATITPNKEQKPSGGQSSKTDASSGSSSDSSDSDDNSGNTAAESVQAAQGTTVQPAGSTKVVQNTGSKADATVTVPENATLITEEKTALGDKVKEESKQDPVLIEKEEVPTVAIPEARGFSWWIVATIAGIGCVAAAGLWFFVGRKEND